MAQRVPIPLAVTSGEMGQKFSSDVELTNLRLVPLPPGSAEPFAVEHDAAIVQLGSQRVTGTPQGSVLCENYVVLSLIAGTVYESDLVSGSLASVGGSTTGTDRVSAAVRTGTHAVFTYAGGDTLASTESGGAAAVVAEPAGTFRAVTYVDGYTIYSRNGTDEFYISALDDPTTVGALDFSTADASPGEIIGLAVSNRDLVIFKDRAVEFWSNTGAAAFPFERRSPGTIDGGLAATCAVAADGDVLYYLGSDLVPRVLRGYQAQSIGSAWVHLEIRAIWTAAGASRSYGDIRLNVTPMYGRKYLVLSAMNYTASLWMDLETGAWHRHSSSGVSFLCTALGESREITSYPVALVKLADGKTMLGKLSLTDYIDQGAATQPRTMTMPQIGDGVRRHTMHEFALHKAAFTAAGNITASWSDDNGATYVSGGAVDGTAKRSRWHRCGSFFSRILRVVFDAGTPVSVRGASAVMDVGE